MRTYDLFVSLKAAFRAAHYYPDQEFQSVLQTACAFKVKIVIRVSWD
jgi:hypothetical protein